MRSIFCSDIQGVIGIKSNISNNYNLSYSIKEDLLRFKMLTAGTSEKQSILITGYNTYMSFGGTEEERIKVLDGFKNAYRTIWTLTKKPVISLHDNLKYFNSYDDIIDEYTKNLNKCTFWIVGGSEIYKLFESLTDTIYQTLVLRSNYAEEDNDRLITYKVPEYYDNDLEEEQSDLKGYDRVSNNEVEYMFKRYKFNSIKYLEYLGRVDRLKDGDNKGENQYLKCLYNTLLSESRITRNATTRSYFGDQLRFDIRNNFPLLTTKKMAMKSIIQELLFFLRGSTDTKELENVGVNIWKGNTNRQFLDENGHHMKNDGDMGPMYGYQWRNFNGQYDQFPELLHNIKTDPFSRRLLLTTYNPLQAHDGVLYPCHSLIIQFYVEDVSAEFRFLSLKMYQRSADVFLGLPFNIASMSVLLHLVANTVSTTKLEYIPKEVIISLGDVHIYDTHIQQGIEQLRRKPLKNCQIEIMKKREKLEDYKYEDIKIINYKSYPAIKADMVA